VELIRNEIRRRGPVPFAWFMEQALYHPEHGYYSSDRAEIGRRGHYFTNVSVGPLFGQLLAFQFAETWRQLGETDNFVVVEQGAHHGEFVRDVLQFVQPRFPEFFGALRYRIIEPFSKLQDRQSQTLAAFRDRVEWRKTLDELEFFIGIHFSNELLDAMPINSRDKLVALSGDRLTFIDSPSTDRTNQSQLDWVASVARKLERGVVLAVDYGFVATEFREVIQARAGHRLLDSPFEQIGNADITAHINWTEIAKAGEQNGFRVMGFTDQHHFLTGILAAYPEIVTAAKSKRALQTLLHPEMLGRSFQVLGLSKDVALAESPSSFKFARNPRQVLGL
jgi:SAM-dependent MidA family methyltransferase